MTETRAEAMRRHLEALRTTTQQLRAQLDAGPGGLWARRGAIAGGWLDRLTGLESGVEPRLVRAPGGAQYVVEADARRRVTSGLLARALTQALGPPEDVGEDTLAGLAEGPPVEVLEAPSGEPFLVVGGRRLPVQGLPLPHPVSLERARPLPLGPELDLGAVAAARDESTLGHARRLLGRVRARARRTGDRSSAGRPGGTPTPIRSSGDAERERRPAPVSGQLPLPTFVIIGAQKCATRWLRLNLGRHPDVFVAREEGVFFHNADTYARGLEWYRGRFAGWDGEQHVGESTPAYMMWRHHPDLVAERIGNDLPDVRLIATLRDPVDRAYSALRHHIVKGRLDEDVDLLDYVRSVPAEEDELGLVAGGWYAASLEPYLDRFGDQLLVLVLDDPRSSLDRLFGQALGHLGLDAGFRPPDLHRVRFSNAAGDGGEAPAVTAERRALHELFADDISRLEGLLGLDLTHWSPERGGDR